MNRRGFLSTLAGAAVAAPQRAAQRPNFVIIYTDDQGIGDLGCYGATDVKTPHLDALAARGARLTDWYSNSPVCSPSRAALLTGKYPQRVGIPVVLTSNASFAVPGLPAGETTLPGALQKSGYRTAAIGKWHVGSAAHSRPLAQGFQDFFGFYSGWIDGFSHRYYTQSGGMQQIFHDLWHNEEEVFADPEYHTELFARQAADQIQRQPKQHPFLLYVAFGAPHYPMIAPRRYTDRFAASMDRDRRMHAAMIAAVDDGVGRIMDALRASGLQDNTVVFFQSDNGATIETRADHAGRPYHGGSNRPFRGYKAGLFEGGIRMPALMSWPGHIRAGSVVSGVGAAMDILPTFLHWAGAAQATPSGIDGRNVAAMFEGGAPSPHDTVFWSYLNQLAARRGRWKLILNPPSFPGEPVSEKLWLSDLETDPSESRNHAAQQTEIVRDLKAALEAWAQSLPRAAA